ncbi:PAS domain S-box protein [Desulfuromonas acetoxidans]|uniref:Sensor protein FixL n=1 Tax=Desulfuromonas acetoxidans (strain DSM 684 / 11070) TaxID=281689 RepID=Q1JW53_DESA6|nr:PAS domain S-box protein [Desulfuromonas acetoxidans]EAT14474.1 multi-sensor signal transduction histidine kinase [Desulfuromonas acetoxidans DSM 684]MBF0644750.1 PAS domain S-box protein [Desulfuromonas acetoxidans]NVD25250.1 PAS domain S-box protein [Desulfuromonas acetoxidans]NVE17346.1 PAS domain S-box protein [Desulfuromonas acetoxidans]
MRRHWIVLGVGAVLACVVFFIGSALIAKDVKQITLEMVLLQHKITERQIERFKLSQAPLLSMLTGHPDVGQFASRVMDDETGVTDLFFHTVKANPVIMQLRLLDLQGNEQIRVDRLRNGEVTVIDDNALQNKAHRDYFQTFSRLKQGEWEFSDFDLNIEQKKIEMPFNPTLRAGMPVQCEGEICGLIIINYYMEDWLHNLGTVVDSRLLLVDRDGYFLLHPEQDWAWSRYTERPRKMDDFYGRDLSSLYLTPQGHAWIDDSTVALPLYFFDQEILAVYRLNRSPNLLYREKILEFSVIMLLALVLVLVPVFWLIHDTMRQMRQEKKLAQNSRDYLDTVFNHTFDAIIVINAQASIQRVNNAALTLFGYSREELCGENVNILVPEPYKSRHDSYVQNYKSTGRMIINADRDISALHADGHKIPVSIAITQMWLDEELYFIGTIRDLSNVKELEERSRKQEMMIQQGKLAAMGEMLGAIAHQWRQPLNSIGLIIQDLASAYKHDDLDGDYFRQSQQEMLQQLHYMSDTIDEFRNFFTQGKKVQACNLLAVLQEITQLYWAQLKAHGISVRHRCYLDGELRPCPTDGDLPSEFALQSCPAEIKQLLLNLIANAKEAIEKLANPTEKQYCIEVQLTATENEITIDVCDLAGGVSSEIRSRIFEPYFTTKKMGTGLGLYIAKTLSTNPLHGTLVYLDRVAEDGDDVVGSIFRLSLPRYPGDVFGDAQK